MKLLYLTNLPSPYVVRFLNELGRTFEITALFERESGRGRDPGWAADEERRFKSVFLRGIHTGDEAAFCPGVLRYLCRGGFDAVVLNEYSTPTGMLAILALKCLRRPFYIGCDGGVAKDGGGPRERWKRFLIGSARGWFSSGRVTDRYLLHYGASAPRICRYPFTSLSSGEILKEPPGPDQKRALRKSLGIDAPLMVLAVGQFIRRKGFDILLRAAAAFPAGTALYLIGGSATPEYREICRTNGLERVTFLDFMPSDQLKNYYDAADVFVLPTRSDIWGLVINEAMARALPVVTTTRCVAGLELVEDGVNGFLVPPDDGGSLAEKINGVLMDSALRQEMARQSLQKIRSYTIEEMAAIYRRALSGP